MTDIRFSELKISSKFSVSYQAYYLQTATVSDDFIILIKCKYAQSKVTTKQ